MNGHGPVNGRGTGPWPGMGTATQAPLSGPNSILDGTPLAGPSRRAQPAAGRRSARKQRVQTRSIFSELADLAAIPRTAYALEQESDGAMCLLRTDEGFEVFSAADGARHEVRTFEDEEAAYFYLFGVLAAEAVRNGSLIPPRPDHRAGQVPQVTARVKRQSVVATGPPGKRPACASPARSGL